jgi:hypothetical protein
VQQIGKGDVLRGVGDPCSRAAPGTRLGDAAEMVSEGRGVRQTHMEAPTAVQALHERTCSSHLCGALCALKQSWKHLSYLPHSVGPTDHEPLWAGPKCRCNLADQGPKTWPLKPRGA